MSVEIIESDSNDSDVFIVKQIKPVNKLTLQQALIIKHGVLSSTQSKNLSEETKKKRKSSEGNEKVKGKKKKLSRSMSSKSFEKKEQKILKTSKSLDIEKTRCQNSSPVSPQIKKEKNSPSKISDYFSPTKTAVKKESEVLENSVDENIQLSPGILKKKKKFQMFKQKSYKSSKASNCSRNISESFEETESVNNDLESKEIEKRCSQEEEYPLEDLLNIINSYEDLLEEKCKDNSELLCFLLKKIIKDVTKKQIELEINSPNSKKPEKLISERECEIFEKFFNLNESSSKLYVRMLCRKKDWHRVSAISYKDISDDLVSEFSTLKNINFVDVNIGDQDLKIQLSLLNKTEIQQISKAFNVFTKSINLNKKNDLINLLIEETKKQKSVLEMMMKNKASRFELLKSETSKILGMCVRLNNIALAAFNKIMLLFSFPHYFDDEESRFNNQLFMCINVIRNVVKFPNYKLSSTVLFKTKRDFESFQKAVHLQGLFESAIVAKDLDAFSRIGITAKEEFMNLLQNKDYQERFMQMESFLQKFSAGSIYARILTKYCDTFKKKRNLKETIKILEMLLDQKLFLKRKRGNWYNILSQVYENLKDNNAAAEIIIRSLEDPYVDEVQKMTLQLKSLTLLKKKSNSVSDIRLREKLDDLCSIIVPEPPSIEIRGKALDKIKPGFKCVYVEENENGKLFTSVEERAILYYKAQGFEKGYHVEGYFLQTIYFLLFFDIIYGLSPPGVYQSRYQVAPLDFYSKSFYLNRKEAIDSLLNEMCGWTDETLLTKLRTAYFDNFNVSCLISWQEHFTPELFYEIIQCITMPTLVLIFQRFIHNFRTTRAGFPDLTLWSIETKKCKFVEVKSPNDKLSSGQRLWLEFLRNIGLDCEVCNVRNISAKSINDGNSCF